jgi:hypothetical protein
MPHTPSRDALLTETSFGRPGGVLVALKPPPPLISLLQ